MASRKDRFGEVGDMMMYFGNGKMFNTKTKRMYDMNNGGKATKKLSGSFGKEGEMLMILGFGQFINMRTRRSYHMFKQFNKFGLQIGEIESSTLRQMKAKYAKFGHRGEVVMFMGNGDLLNIRTKRMFNMDTGTIRRRTRDRFGTQGTLMVNMGSGHFMDTSTGKSWNYATEIKFARVTNFSQ